MFFSALRPSLAASSSDSLGCQESPFLELVVGDRNQLPVPAHLPCGTLGPPHLAVPLISDSLDLNLFPPHLLRGSLVPERKGLLGGQEPHTVLMNVWD